MKLSRERLVVIFGCVFLVALVVLAQRGLYKGGGFGGERFHDFRAYHVTAQAFLAGDLVAAYEHPQRPLQYPPPFALFVAPLGFLPEVAGVWVWVILKILLVALIFRHLDRVFGMPLSAEAKLAGFVLTLRFLDSDFANGNANVVIVSCVIFAFHFLRTGRDARAGTALGCAMLAKVTPVIVLPWMLARRCWRVAAACLLIATVLVVAVPVVGAAWESGRRAWAAWYRSTLSGVDMSSQAYAAEPGKGYVPGQSLRALVHRLCRDSDATAHDDRVVSIHLVDLTKKQADGLYLLLAGLIYVAVLAGFRYRTPGRSRSWTGSELAAALLLMPLLGPLSRKASFVALWPASVLAFEAWWQVTGRTRKVGAALWFAALLLVVLSSREVLGKQGSTYAMAFCPYAWAALLLLVLLVHPSFFPRSSRRLSANAAACGGADTTGCE